MRRLLLPVLIVLACAATAGAASTDPGAAKLASTPNGPGPHLAEWQITTPAKERANQAIVDDGMAKGAYEVIGVPDPAYHKYGKPGYLLALFTKDTPLRPVPGAVVRQLPYTRAQYKTIFDGIYALVMVPGTNNTRSYYSLSTDIDPDTGKVVVGTNAPKTLVDTLNKRFPGMLDITCCGPVAVTANLAKRTDAPAIGVAASKGGGGGSSVWWWVGGALALLAAGAGLLVARTRPWRTQLVARTTVGDRGGRIGD